MSENAYNDVGPWVREFNPLGFGKHRNLTGKEAAEQQTPWLLWLRQQRFAKVRTSNNDVNIDPSLHKILDAKLLEYKEKYRILEDDRFDTYQYRYPSELVLPEVVPEAEYSGWGEW